MRFRFFIAAILLFVFTAAGFAREVKIQVVVTTDVHGRLFSYDFVNDRPFDASLANVHYLLQAARTQSSNNIILLDNGDLLQGTPAAYYANFVQDHKRNLFSRVMNLMKYDAATVGNHDIEAGPQVYNRLQEEFAFPYLGANVLDDQSGEPYFTPYTIIKRQGVKVAVLGLTTTGVPNWLPPHLWEGLEFQSMVEAARYWVPYIQEHEKPDVLIGLFHSGMGPREFDPQRPEPDNASQYIAANVPGFDVIFTGHDHRERMEVVANNQGGEVLIMGAAPHAGSVAVAEITMEQPSRKTFSKKKVQGELLSTKDVVPSHEYLKAFQKEVDEILAFSSETVGTLSNDIYSIDAFYGSAPFSDLIHSVQLEVADAQISFTAPLAFNEVLKAGRLRVRDFFKLYQYENYLYAMELTGQEVLDYLEYSYSLWLNHMQGPDDHLLLLRQDQEGNKTFDSSGRMMLRHPYFNFDSAAGIKYTVDVSKPAGSRVHILSMSDGAAFETGKVYRVAINSYRGSGGGGHLTTGAGLTHEQISSRIVFTSQKDLRTELVNYFRQRDQVEVKALNHWKITPELWREQGRQKDRKALKIEVH
ncbi:MAG: bifunctional metallophosphatase/5'-nucleotidase [Bacteroidales bacterium]